MALKVLNVGQTGVLSANYNTNTPTTPRAVIESSAYSSPIIAAVYPDDTTLESIYPIIAGGSPNYVGTEYSNIEKTEGNVIKTYSSTSSEGVNLSGISNTVDLLANHYFIMVNSNNSLTHHFAKITEILAIDDYGDGVKFEPSLGKEIVADTKFKLFKGPAITSDFVAIGLGIKSELQDDLVVARPHFWFKPDLNKKNELNNNTKYMLRTNAIASATSSFLRIDTGANSLKTTFLVSQDYSTKIVDYSRFTMKAKLIDNLRDLDVVAASTFTATLINTSNQMTSISIDANTLLFRGLSGNGIPVGTYVTAVANANELTLSNNANAGASIGGTITILPSNESVVFNTLDYTDYEEVFTNARRDGDDLLLATTSNFTSRGPIRYLHYSYSPEKANYSYNVISAEINESIKKKTSYSDIKIADIYRIYPSKIFENDALRVRHRLSRANLNEWKYTTLDVTVAATVVSSGSEEYRLLFVGLDKFFTAGEEIKIGDRIYLIKAMGTSSGTPYINLAQVDYTNDSTIKVYSRLDTDSIYTNTGLPSFIGEKIYRRAFSPFNKTLLNSFDLISDRYDDLHLLTTSKNATYSYFNASADDYDNNLLTFTISNDNYFDDAFHFDAEYYLYYEKLNGLIEILEYYRENGQTIMNVQGRDIISNILSPVLNKNTVFSEDIIYSSIGPLNELVSLSAYASAEFSSKTINIKNSSNAALSITLVAGDKLYIKTDAGYTRYVGEIKTGGTANNFLMQSYSQVQCTGARSDNSGIYPLYKAKVASNTNQIRNYVFNKALASNILTNSVTSLSGSSNKGLFITGGSALDTSGLETTLLTNTSANADSKAIGYNISKVDGEINGADYQCVLGDGLTTETHESFVTVNTLMDYTVVSTRRFEDSYDIEIAPYIPVTLGRVENNYANTYNLATNVTIGTTAGSAVTDEKWLIVTIPSDAIDITVNSPIYMDSIFIGLYRGHMITAGWSSITLDRECSYVSGQTLTAYKPTSSSDYGRHTKTTHELELINTGHLHGGKIISLAYFTNEVINSGFGPVIPSLNVMLENSQNIYTSFEKFGSPIYSIYSLEKGSAVSYAASHKIENERNNITSLFKYARFDTDYVYNHLPIEARGVNPPSGSNYFDKTILPDNGTDAGFFAYPDEFVKLTNSVDSALYSELNSFNIKDNLNIRTKSVDRMFIFVNSDEHPYSDKRNDSLASSIRNRDVTKYSVMGMLAPQSTGSGDTRQTDTTTNRYSNLDGDYTTSNITSADKDIHKLLTFGLMRLTEVVLDWSFNQIDPEKPIDPKQITGAIKLIEPVASNLNGGSQFTILIGDYATATTINCRNSSGTATSVLGGSDPLAVGDMIIDSNNSLIGIVGAISGDGLTVTFKHDTIKTTKSASTDVHTYFVGNINKLKKAQVLSPSTLRGFGVEDTFAAFNSNIHMNRSAYINQPAITSSNYRMTVTIPTTTSGAGLTDPSVTWIAHELYDITGTLHKEFFWFNQRTSSGTATYTQTTPTVATGSNTYSTYTITEVQVAADWNDKHSRLQEAYSTRIINSSSISTNPLVTIKLFNSTNTIFENIYGTPDITKLVRDNAADVAKVQYFGEVGDLDRTDDLGWGLETDSAFWKVNDNKLGGTINSSIANQRIAGTYLPVNILGEHSATFTSYFDVLQVLGRGIKSDSFANIAVSDSENLFQNFIPIALDGFKIEDNGEREITAGETFPAIDSGFITETNHSGTKWQLFGLKSATSSEYARYRFYLSAGESRLITTPRLEAAGYMQGFKPVLETASLTVTTSKAAGNKSVYACAFASTGKHKWLDFLDLTGCYLVKVNPLTIPFNDISATPIYVLSHELDTTNTSRSHIITTDVVLTDTSKYKILQPNHTTFYDYSPKEILTGYLTSDYTKKPNRNECYTSIKSHTVHETGTNANAITDKEGVGSMYVFIDTSGELGGDSIVSTNAQTEYLRSKFPTKVCLSDGDTSFTTTASLNGPYLSFDKIKELKGITSVSETITLSVGKTFDRDSPRCVIGSTVTISSDAEQLAQELLSNENLAVTIETAPTYSTFTAPDFQGSSLLSAIRNLLQKKGRDITVKNGEFVIGDDKATSNFANVLLNQNGDYHIYEYEKTQSTFDFHNEIIVYGASHKSVKKDLRSVKKLGRKTLEVFEGELITQEDTDRRGRELLSLHSKLNKTVTVTVSTKGLEQIKSGDIIQLEIPSENLERDSYLILGITHLMSGLMKVHLGRYSKDLEDRFAELLIDNKNTKSYIRNKVFKAKSEQVEVIDTIKIKEIRYLVRKRSSGGASMTLGFGTPLNTTTAQLGFEGGTTVVLTDLTEGSI